MKNEFLQQKLGELIYILGECDFIDYYGEPKTYFSPEAFESNFLVKVK